MVKPPQSILPMLLATVAAAVLGVVKSTSDDFRRPLAEDELITLRVYTGAGTNGDGTPRDLSRREQLEQLKPLSPSELAIGMYASLGRWAEPTELGGAAVFLSSEAASFINGHILYVDGAFTATV